MKRKAFDKSDYNGVIRSTRTYYVCKYYYEPTELKRFLKKTFGEVELLLPLHYELLCVAKNTT